MQGSAVGYIEEFFDPEATHAMGAAFDSAWHDLTASGDIFSSQFPAHRAREKIAKRIIDMAQRGERDADRLGEDALAYLARQAAPSTIPHPQHRRALRIFAQIGSPCGRIGRENPAVSHSLWAKG
jgi:hypothetical protein